MGYAKEINANTPAGPNHRQTVQVCLQTVWSHLRSEGTSFGLEGSIGGSYYTKAGQGHRCRLSASKSCTYSLQGPGESVMRAHV